jgi:hypothetical protein
MTRISIIKPKVVLMYQKMSLDAYRNSFLRVISIIIEIINYPFKLGKMRLQWSKATFFGFIEFSHDIFSTKIDIPMNEQTSQSSKSIFCHCRSAPVFQASHSQNISAEHVEDIHTRYEDDLPDSIGFIAEMERWKMLCTCYLHEIHPNRTK